YSSRPFISSLFDLVRALTFSCSLRSCFMTQFSLGRRDSMIITSSPSPSESELVASSLVTSFFFLVSSWEQPSHIHLRSQSRLLHPMCPSLGLASSSWHLLWP